jgi:hypothetical protein
MHILRGRLNGQISELGRPESVSPEVVEGWVSDNGELLGMLARLLPNAPRQGMKFTNEMYIARHLLTAARHQMEGIAAEARSYQDPNVAVPPDDRIRALDLYVAAKTTIVAAENLLPARSRLIDGESFWDRFSRVSHEREQGARQHLMQEQGR